MVTTSVRVKLDVQRAVRVRSRGDRMPILALVVAMTWLSVAVSGLSLELAAAGAATGRRFLEIRADANIRDLPSLDADILVLARKGAVVELLGDNDEWYLIQTREGVVGWVYKPLTAMVSNRPKPPSVGRQVAPAALSAPTSPPAGSQVMPAASPNSPSEKSPAVGMPPEREASTPMIIEEELATTAETEPDEAPVLKGVEPSSETEAGEITPAEPWAVPPADEPQPSPASTLAPKPEPEQTQSAPIEPAVRLDGVHLNVTPFTLWLFTAGLAAVLFLVIGLHLRMSRALRRVTHQVEQIAPRPISEAEGVVTDPAIHQFAEILQSSSAETAVRSSDITPPAPMPQDRSVTIVPIQDLPVELSPLEWAVLTALHERGELAESELRAELGQRGFAGVLLKATMSELVAKTRVDGRAWVRVRYAAGRFSYRLQLDDTPESAHAHHAPYAMPASDRLEVTPT
jgi:hypothetical protein